MKLREELASARRPGLTEISQLMCATSATARERGGK